MSDRQVMMTATLLFLLLVCAGPFWAFPRVEHDLNRAAAVEPGLAAQGLLQLTWTGRDGYLWVAGEQGSMATEAERIATRLTGLQGVRDVHIMRAESSRFAVRTGQAPAAVPVSVSRPPAARVAPSTEADAGANRRVVELTLRWDPEQLHVQGQVPQPWQGQLERIGLTDTVVDADVVPPAELTQLLNVLLPWLEGERLLLRGELSFDRAGVRLEGQVASVEELSKIQEVLRSLPVTAKLSVVAPPEAAAELAEAVRLQPIEFVHSTARPTVATRPVLARMAEVLLAHPKTQVRIVGHTDDHGPAALNARLSLRRAKAVRHSLVAAGVSATRVQAEGRGEEAPVADNRSVAGRQRNRRVEVIVQEEL